MAENHVSTSTITIDATADRVWRVITDPDAAREFLVGTTMSTDWRVGRPISWRGTWQGRDYEDKGIVLEVDPGRRLVYTHFSPLTGEPDVPENYHTLTWTITGERPVASSSVRTTTRAPPRPRIPRRCGTPSWPPSSGSQSETTDPGARRAIRTRSRNSPYDPLPAARNPCQSL